MAGIMIDRIEKNFGAVTALEEVSLNRRGWRVHRAARTFGLRQDHAAAHHRGAGDRKPRDAS